MTTRVPHSMTVGIDSSTEVNGKVSTHAALRPSETIFGHARMWLTDTDTLNISTLPPAQAMAQMSLASDPAPAPAQLASPKKAKRKTKKVK